MSPPTAAIYPAEVTAGPGDVVTAELIVTNPAATSLVISDVRVRAADHTTVADPEIAEQGQAVPARSVARFVLEIRPAAGFAGGDLTALVDLRTADPSTDLTLAATITTSPADRTAPLTLEVLGLPKKLNDQEEGTIVIEVANDSPVTVADVAVRAFGGDDLRLGDGTMQETPKTHRCPTDAVLVACIAALQPGAVEVVQVPIEVADRVRTGTHSIVFSAKGTTDGGGEVVATDVTAKTELDVSVFGLDVLSPFGITVLFVVPGIVAVLTFSLLTRFAYPRRPSTDSTIDVKDPRLMVFVVPASALAYLIASLRFGEDVLARSGTGLVAGLFASGLLIGIVPWLAVSAGYWTWVDRKRIRTSDSPFDLIRRLAAQGSPLTDLAVRKVGEDSLCDLGAEGDKRLLSPQISYWVTGSEDQRQKARAAVTSGQILKVRWARLRGRVRFEWAAPGGIRVATPTADGGSANLLRPQA